MTTIVWKGGVLACDSQSSFGNHKYKCKTKLQLDDDIAFAICGALAEGLLIIDWCRSEEPAPFPGTDDTTVVMMCRRTGKAWTIEHPGAAVPIEDKLFAAGSGAGIALGALAMGATPEEAVDAACKWDEASGFGVQVVVSEKARRARERKAKQE